MGGSVFNRDQAQAYAQGGVPGGPMAPEGYRSPLTVQMCQG